MKTLEIPMERFGEPWKTYNIIVTKDLGDGTCLLVSITQSLETEDLDEPSYCTVIYRVEHGKPRLRKPLRRETFGNIRDAIHYCETADLSEFGITIK